MPLLVLLLILICLVSSMAGGVYVFNRAVRREKGEDPSHILPDGSEDIYMQNTGGLLLHAVARKSDDSAKGRSHIERPWAILCHGHESDALGTLEYAGIFEKLGFNVLMLDLRAHGQSEGKYIGMGWLDAFDIREWTMYINEHYKAPEILLFGISMGASSCLCAGGIGLPENVTGIVEDCGFSSIKKEVAHVIKKKHLPAFPILNCAALISKIFAGYSLRKDGNCAQLLKGCTLPILFIHGEADTFVPPKMMDKLYKSSRGDKMKLVVLGAGHGRSLETDPEKYEETVAAFCYRYFRI